jgi:hypothetical protein
MKRKALASIFISLLLFSVVGISSFLSLGRANPLTFTSKNGSVHPSIVGAKPPIVTVQSPQNNSFFNQDNVTLSFNVTVGSSVTNSTRWITLIYYETDWQQNKNYVYKHRDDELSVNNYAATLNLTGINGTRIPEGEHNLTFHVSEEGITYDPPRPYGSGLCRIGYYSFYITGSSSVTFTVDRTCPTVSVLSMENKTYETSDVPLNFTVNESVSQTKYSLDGQENVTIAGNTTLPNLPFGEHNITVYATDEAGNIGKSETLFFTIAEPFPTLLVATASIIIVIIVVAVFLQLRKHKH